MTTNQTISVPRELARRLVAGKPNSSWDALGDDRLAATEELRALLDGPADVPADRCGVQMADCPECSHQWDHFFECGNKPAAQPQGEPVAWQYRVSAGPQTGWSLWHDGKGEEFKQSYQVETRPLYAEQPAPVAVVLPERKHHVHQGLSHTDAKADGWNACIDEVNRLNTPQ